MCIRDRTCAGLALASAAGAMRAKQITTAIAVPNARRSVRRECIFPYHYQEISRPPRVQAHQITRDLSTERSVGRGRGLDQGVVERVN